MTLFTVLTLFATLSTQITLLVGTASLAAQQFGEYEAMDFLFNLYCWLIPVDCVVNSICLYLMLEENNKKYKTICGRCDAHITNSCQQLAKRCIKRHYVSIQNANRQTNTDGAKRSSALLKSSNSTPFYG